MIIATHVCKLGRAPHCHWQSARALQYRFLLSSCHEIDLRQYTFCDSLRSKLRCLTVRLDRPYETGQTGCLADVPVAVAGWWMPAAGIPDTVLYIQKSGLLIHAWHWKLEPIISCMHTVCTTVHSTVQWVYTVVMCDRPVQCIVHSTVHVSCTAPRLILFGVFKTMLKRKKKSYEQKYTKFQLFYCLLLMTWYRFIVWYRVLYWVINESLMLLRSWVMRRETTSSSTLETYHTVQYCTVRCTVSCVQPVYILYHTGAPET